MRPAPRPAAPARRQRQQTLDGDLGARQFGGDQPVAEHQHPGADGGHLLKIGGHHQQGCAGRRPRPQHAVDLSLGAHVHAGGGLVQQHQRFVERKPARQHHFLLVATRELLHLGGRRRWVDIKLADQRPGPAGLASAPAPRQTPVAVQRRVGEQVFQHAHRRRQVLVQPLTGHTGHPGADGVGRSAKNAVLAQQTQAAGGQRLTAEDGPADGLMAGAAQSHQAQHLTGVHHQAERAGIAAGRAVKLQHGPLRRLRQAWRCGLGRAGRQGFADDPAHQLGLAGQRRVLHRHQLAVAHHRRPVRYRQHLVQPVRDVNHRHALGAQPAQHAKQPLHIGHRQAGGRLVQHQQPGLHGQRPADSQQRLFGPGE